MIRTLRRLAFSVFGLLLAASLPAQGAEEWVSLFDGKTLGGWESLPLNPKNPSKWEVVDGELRGSGGQSMIFSPKGGYTNFRFRAEIKINDRGNSGMYFRTPKEGTFSKGYEAQINSTHTDPIKTGSVYTMVHIFDQLVPPDTWFTQEVEVRDIDYRGKMVTQIKVKVNDKLLYEYLDHARTWKEGHFAFQQHDPGSKVSLRKIEVLELPRSSK
ncbi:MAG: DUF1080 domain-containing protein [Isosphaeraceae bacterium]|jgi:hypothetical protein|nr:DUF1080 domain-containing protein [Isosphaeraceae bacterium]